VRFELFLDDQTFPHLDKSNVEVHNFEFKFSTK